MNEERLGSVIGGDDYRVPDDAKDRHLTARPEVSLTSAFWAMSLFICPDMPWPGSRRSTSAIGPVCVKTLDTSKFWGPRTIAEVPIVDPGAFYEVDLFARSPERVELPETFFSGGLISC